MTNLYPRNLFGFLFLFLSLSVFSQGPGCPNVEAGWVDDEVGGVLTCEETCLEISATFLETGETTSYAVSSIPYDPPFPAQDPSSTPIIPPGNHIDDVWSNIIHLPFEFCFFV